MRTHDHKSARLGDLIAAELDGSAHLTAAPGEGFCMKPFRNSSHVWRAPVRSPERIPTATRVDRALSVWEAEGGSVRVLPCF